MIRTQAILCKAEEVYFSRSGEEEVKDNQKLYKEREPGNIYLVIFMMYQTNVLIYEQQGGVINA